MNSTRLTRWLVYLLIGAAVAAVFWSYSSAPSPQNDIPISQLAQEIQANEVAELQVSGDGRNVTVVYVDQSRQPARASTSNVSSIEEVLATYGISSDSYADDKPVVTYERPSQWGGLLNLVGIFLPALLIIGFFYFIFRQAQGTNNQAMSFGKSRARMFTGDHPTVGFDDVAGCDEAKEELQEIVEFLKEPEKFVSFGARIPKGVLLVGSPGTGKTLLAKAVSGEAGVPFFSIAGSEFVEMFVGVGASRVRDLFEQAKRNSPCIIFIDEIDAVGRQRGAGLGGSHDEREQTLNQILVEMDGFDTDTHVIILAATNRPDILDPALLRPGRFDRRVVIDRPDMRGREAIFRVHLRGKPIANAVDVLVLAKATPGFVGADIENTVNEAALLAARRNRKSIGMTEFQEAIERVQLGPERKSRIMSPEEKELTAYHEAGHAMVSHFLPHAQTLRKITIIPRGMAGGVTWYMDEDTSFLTRSKFEAMIATALGGRVAEEIVFGEITTGASNDLQQVTRIARAMVTQYGMSSELGLRVYGEKQELVFLGREISEQRDYSDAIAEQIDGEVRRIIDSAHRLATTILTEHRDKLDEVSQKLLEVETLEAAEFIALMDGKEVPASSTPTTGSPKVSSPKPTEPAERPRPSLDRRHRPLRRNHAVALPADMFDTGEIAQVFGYVNDVLQSIIVIFGAAVILYNVPRLKRGSVPRAFSTLIGLVVLVYMTDLLVSRAIVPASAEFLLRAGWIGVAMVPAALFHLSDALLTTTGKISRRRRVLVILGYVTGIAFALLGVFSDWVVGPPLMTTPTPRLTNEVLFPFFTAYFWGVAVCSIYNVWRARQRCLTTTTRRRMTTTLFAILAAPLGVFPYTLLIGDPTAEMPLALWPVLILGNFVVSILFAVLTSQLVYFGSVSPDRVVRVRLYKYMARVPLAATIVLLVFVLVDHAPPILGLPKEVVLGFAVVTTVMIVEWIIHQYKKTFERAFQLDDDPDVRRIQVLSERLLTTSDLKQFLESVLAATCEAVRTPTAFVAGLTPTGPRLEAVVGPLEGLPDVELQKLSLPMNGANGALNDGNDSANNFFVWGDYWIQPLYNERSNLLLGILGMRARAPEPDLTPDELELLSRLRLQAAAALEDRILQQEVFAAVESILPEIIALQERRSAATFGGLPVLTAPVAVAHEELLQDPEFSNMVREALTHYWGGPKLTESPLLQLEVVQREMEGHDNNPVSALRAILSEAIEQQKPDGQRSLTTTEWILYNILDLKFVQGRRVRDVARRLAMSESDLYRKQRVAIENVARTIANMERATVEESEESFEPSVATNAGIFAG